MSSEKQHELYTQFEPDANEIVFGQRTAPDRPLTEKEISKRRKIILKLVDQKLKFELIELMKIQMERRAEVDPNALNVRSSSLPFTNGHTYTNTGTTPSNDPQYSNLQLQSGNTWPQQSYAQQYPIRIPNERQFFASSAKRISNKKKRLARKAKRARYQNTECEQQNPNLVHPSADSLAKSTLCKSATMLSNVSSTSLSTSKFNPFKVNPFIFRNPTSPQREESSSFCESGQKDLDPQQQQQQSSTLTIDLTTEPSSSKTMKRKQEHCPNVNDNADTLITNSTDARNVTIGKSIDEHGTDVNWLKVAESEINLSILDAGHNEPSSESTSNEWKAMNALVWDLFQKRPNNWIPLTPSELKMKNELLVQVTIDPNALRDNEPMTQLLGKEKINDFINDCKGIDTNSGTTPSNDPQYSNLQLQSGNTWQQQSYAQQYPIRIPNERQFFAPSAKPLSTTSILTKKQRIAVRQILARKAKRVRQQIATCEQQNPNLVHPSVDSLAENTQCKSTTMVSNISPINVLTSKSNPFNVNPFTFCNSAKREESRPRSLVESSQRIAHNAKDLDPQQQPSTLTIDLTTEPSPNKTMERKQEHCPNVNGNADALITNSTDATNFIIGESVEEQVTDVNWLKVAESEINLSILDAGRNETSSESTSNEWKAMNALVWDLFQNRPNNWIPLTPSELKMKNELLVQVTIDPNALRDNEPMRQLLGKKKIDDFINDCNGILAILRGTSLENQALFVDEQSKLIAELKDLSADAHSKIATILSPFLSAQQNIDHLVDELLLNPRALYYKQNIKDEIIAKGQSIGNIMKRINEVVDEITPVRLPKKLNFQVDHWFDVPFVVNLYDRTGKMTEQYAAELTKVLFESIACLKIDPKPSLRDIKFKDGSLFLVCLNKKSFDWLEHTISNHLAVNVCPVKNVIATNQLKTICLKFKRPQYLRFNCLMERLKVDNHHLLTRRWELRTPNHTNVVVDSTKCIYVGVDIQSLISLEKMNRVAKLGDSSVTFEISYNENEENFEKMTRGKKRK